MLKKILNVYDKFTYKKLREKINKLEKELSEANKELEAFNELIEISRKEGSIDAWTLIQVAIYDLYTSMDILDYSSLITAIYKKLELYSEYPELGEKKSKEFIVEIQRLQNNRKEE